MMISSSGQERRNWLFSSMMRVSRQLWQKVWPQEVSSRGTLSLLYSFLQSGHSKSLSITESNYTASQKRKWGNISNYHLPDHLSWWSWGTPPPGSSHCSPVSSLAVKYPIHLGIYPSRSTAHYSWYLHFSAPRIRRTLSSPPSRHLSGSLWRVPHYPSSHISPRLPSTLDCYQHFHGLDHLSWVFLFITLAIDSLRLEIQSTPIWFGVKKWPKQGDLINYYFL